MKSVLYILGTVIALIVSIVCISASENGQVKMVEQILIAWFGFCGLFILIGLGFKIGYAAKGR